MGAYDDALARCSTDWAPWFVIPAETRWYRNLLVARIVVRALENLDMHYPKPNFDPKKITIP
jgi:polyphosphate kinase 2 (PPK2 family)